jgi:hypothetical protein
MCQKSPLWFIYAAYQSNHLDATLLKLILQFRKRAELGSANGCEIGGVGEEDSPAVANPLVEVDLALGGQGLEVRG